jgi:nucleoside-diphosphate-sugar epimerase
MREGDVVLHLAALIGIPYSYHAPASYVLTNVTGTLNILEAARRGGASRVVITSTSEVYGTAKYAPMDEEHPLQGQSPYSASKIAADKLAEAYYCSFELPVVTLRPFNTFGPRQSARAIIPTVLAQALSGDKEIRLGNLSPKRDLTFVKDSAGAFVLAAETPGIEGEVIHFGQGKAVSIGELAQKCIEVVGKSARIISETERKRPARSEVEVLLCNPAKARRLLGWTPKVTLEEGLRRSAEHIRSNMSEYKPRRYNL